MRYKHAGLRLSTACTRSSKNLIESLFTSPFVLGIYLMRTLKSVALLCLFGVCFVGCGSDSAVTVSEAPTNGPTPEEIQAKELAEKASQKPYDGTATTDRSDAAAHGQ
jgi:hypothetical protein